MKQFMFALLLVAGFSFSSQAQNLDYYIYNSSPTNTWDFGMVAGSMAATYELGMAPSTLTTGTYGPFFTLPLQWKAQDNAGCWVSGVMTAAPSSGGVATSCGSTVYFAIQQSAPFLFEMKMQFP